MGDEAFKPGQLVIEFRSRLRIPIGEVDGSDQDSLNSGFDVAGLVIVRISRQACASQYGSMVSRKNSYAVPGPLPLPDCFVPRSPKGFLGKLSLLRLELLEANQDRRLSSRLLMLLMLNVATLTRAFSVSVFLGACQKDQ